MSRLNLFTFNFKPGPKALREMFLTMAGVLVWLLLMELGLSLVFYAPVGRPKGAREKIGAFIYRGLSVEAKLRMLAGKDQKSSDPLARAGWLDAPEDKLTDFGPEQKVAVYGMSFSNHVAHALHERNPALKLRRFAGPAASPGHSFAGFNRDRKRHNAKHVVLGILADEVRGLEAATRSTLSFQRPAPYTFPRYSLKNGKLKAKPMLIHNLDEWRNTFTNPQKRLKYVQHLKDNDRFYSSFIFEKDALDYLFVGRLLRQSWAARHFRNKEAELYGRKGFNPDAEAVKTLRVLVKDFYRLAKEDGRVGIVLLFHTQGYKDHLFKVLEKEVQGQKYVANLDFCSATDYKSFLKDGHFTAACNKIFAARLDKIIQETH